jgi:hypothetical protein
VQETRRLTIRRNAKSEVSHNKPTDYGTCAGPVLKYTSRCQSSKAPEITGGPEYSGARCCVLCAEFWRSNRSGVLEFCGAVVTTGYVLLSMYYVDDVINDMFDRWEIELIHIDSATPCTATLSGSSKLGFGQEGEHTL